jgi:hypothetical protein
MSCKQLRENRDAIQSWRRLACLFPKISARLKTFKECGSELRRLCRMTRGGSARYRRRFSLEVLWEVPVKAPKKIRHSRCSKVRIPRLLLASSLTSVPVPSDVAGNQKT